MLYICRCGEKNVQLVDTSIVSVQEVEGSNIQDIDSTEGGNVAEGVNTTEGISDMSIELRNIIKQEFAADSN